MGTIPGPGFDSPQLHQKSNSRALAPGFFVIRSGWMSDYDR